MNDRELLEMAAKAAGYEFDYPMLGDGPSLALDGMRILGLRLACGAIWNPLTGDGDALRLAVKLELDLCIYADGAEVLSKTVEAIREDAYEDHRMDVCAATRRAIVRAAAEIGRSMP